VAVAVLGDLGFVDLREKVKVGPGIEISIEAVDRMGASWLFDVSGGFTASKPGLARTDTLWRAIGRAAAIDAHREGRRLVLLTSHRPPERSPAARVLAEVVGPDRPIFDVIQLLDREDMARLAAHADG
jgi:hypothetical protein